MAVPFSGSMVALLAGASVFNGSYQEEAGVAYYPVGVLFVGALALLAWLPVLRARRMVLSDLSPEIVDSRLTITFRPRAGKDHLLAVHDDSVEIIENTSSNDKFRRSFPLTDVSSVDVWTEPEPTDRPVRDDEERILPAGELLGITVPAGQLAFAPAEPARAKRFVEARVALARERAATSFDG